MNNKKIGIITFHRAYNYGALLQAYALKSILENEKNDVHIVDYYNEYIYRNHKLFHPFRKNLLEYAKEIFYDFRNLKTKKERINKFEEFINSNFSLINVKEEENLNCVITGSDQVWNYNITGTLDDYYTLNNLNNNNIKKISYAASVGDSSLIHNKKREYIEKISKIDCISVREEDTKDVLKSLINKEIDVVLDPTLLLTKKDWNEKIKDLKDEKEKYILAYVVEPDQEYIKIVNDLSEKTGLKVLHFGIKNPGYKKELKSAYAEGPLEFVNYIKNAEYVVATSFHATVFSMLFNKRFFIIPHKKTGARVTNLLEKLEIENRTFSSLEEFKSIDYNFTTDWEKVNKNIELEREKSLKWLKNAICSEEGKKNV